MKKILLILTSFILLGNVVFTLPGEMIIEEKLQQENSTDHPEQSKAAFSQYLYSYFLASSRSETAIDFSGSSYQLSAFEKSFRKYASLLRHLEPVLTTNVFRYVLRNNCYRLNYENFKTLYPFHEFS